MTIYTVQWGGWDDLGEVQITTAEELDTLLDQVATRRDEDGLGYKVGIFAEVARSRPLPFGMEITLGHPDRAWLFYSGPEGTGLGFDPDLPPWDGEPVWFNTGGDASDFGADRLLLTPELARQAIREYVQTGQRPTCVQWDMGLYDD